MSKIFVSHATADRALAKLIVEFMKEAIGVPGASIFCSSLKGHGIPFAEDFNEYMKNQIQKPDLVILLMTEAYLESPFCLMETGACWANSLRALPVVVPPVTYDTVTKTLGLKQAWTITDHAGLIDFKKLVVEQISVEPRDEHTWDQKRAKFRVDLRGVMRDLKGATKVSADHHKAVVDQVAEQTKEIEALGSLLEEANSKISMLEKAKDRTNVKAVKKAFGGANALQEGFDTLIKRVAKARPSNTSMNIFMHIIMDHFGKAPQIDWFHERDDFERAIQYNLINPDEPHAVEWGKSKLAPLRRL
jgi:TIR domain